MGAPGTGVLKTRKGKLIESIVTLKCLCRIVNARFLETRIEVEGNGSVDSWGAFQLVCRRVHDRAIHVMRTENPGHVVDHQEMGPGDGGNCITGLHPLPFCTSLQL